MNNTLYNLFMGESPPNDAVENVSAAEHYRKMIEECEEWLKRQELNKVSFAVTSSITQHITLHLLQNFIHTVMKKDTLLQLYITKFVVMIAQQKENIQSVILSKLKCFRRKVVDNLFIQSFISRFTRQSIQLLPAS